MLATILKAVGTFLAAFLVVWSQRISGATSEELKTVKKKLEQQAKADEIDATSMSVDDATRIMREHSSGK